jgi:N-acyl-D-amino-acid deacylase
MGLVTEVVGSCGTSAAPINERFRDELNEQGAGSSWGFYVEVDWLSLSQWAKKVEEKGTGINIAPLVGHGTVRTCVMGVEGSGGERIVPTQSEMEDMKNMVDSGMRDGAFGLSTGLTYAPGRNALTGELVELMGVVAKYGGIYSSHMRNEADMLIQATNEFIEVCERTGARGCISHHKAAGPTNFGKVHETLRLIEAARRRGVEIIVDMYPWRIGGIFKSLGFRFRINLPDGTVIKDRKTLLEKLKDQKKWEELKATVQGNDAKNRDSYEARKREIERAGGWTPPFGSSSGIILHSPSHPELEWKTFDEVTEALGEMDRLEAFRRLLLDDSGCTVSGNIPFNESDMATIASYSGSTFITDQRAIDNSKYSRKQAIDGLVMEHPRGWGTYPKVLGEYVRERGLLTLEDAIRKITSLPANLLGLQDRGLLKEGFWGDIVIFEPETVRSKATYADPWAFPEGINYVLVNGDVAVNGNKLTSTLAGKVLKRPA